MIATRVRHASRTSPHSPLRLDRSRDIRRSVAARDISRSAPGVVLDLRDVDLLDTDGVIKILEAARRIRARGGSVCLHHVSEQVRWRLELAGVYRLVEPTPLESNDGVA